MIGPQGLSPPYARVVREGYEGMNENEFDTEQAGQETPSEEISAPVVDDSSKAAVAELLRIQAQAKSGANWFYWIAALSVINSIMVLTGSGWSFIVGLGITQLVDGAAEALIEEGVSNARVVCFAINLIIAGVFVLFGAFANRKHLWAFVVGMLLYALDGLLFLLVMDYLSIGFHVFVLFSLYGGLKATNKLKQLERGPVADVPL
jgi:hypothetical protein